MENIIFDFETDENARALRDKTMVEITSKFAARNKNEADEQRQEREERQKVLEEKNRLAAENEKERQQREKEKKERSDKAIANLIESRKRRR